MSNNNEDWITKSEAAALLGVAEKTLDRMAAAGQIQKASRSRVGMAPVTVFHPGDIERERERRQPKPQAFVVPHTSDTSNVSAKIPAIDPKELLAALIGQKSDTWGPPLFLTTEQAVRYTGLSEDYLGSLVKAGKLLRIEGMRGYRYKRKDLDAL